MDYFCMAAFAKNSELYTWINSLPTECDLIEVGQLHRGSLVALVKTAAPINRPITCVDFFCYQGTGERFLKAYHKQNATAVNHGLLIVDCEHLSEICAIVLTDSAYEGLQLLEISRNALPGGAATAIFVNVDNFTFPDSFSGAHIAQLNPQLRKLF
jgi:hypothetical protein